MTTDIADRANYNSAVVYRSFDMDTCEIRSDETTGDLVFEGVASVVEHPYTVRDMFGEYTETIAEGAFNKTIREGNRVSLYVNHRHSDVPLATRKGGNLELFADPHLRIRARLDPNRADVQTIASAVQRGDMTEMSIGFRPLKARDEWNDDYTEVVRRELDLREASIVEQGANTGGTVATMRAFDDFMLTITDTEMSDDEVRRAIAHLESLLDSQPVADDEADEMMRQIAERDRLDRERLARKRHPVLAP